LSIPYEESFSLLAPERPQFPYIPYHTAVSIPKISESGGMEGRYDTLQKIMDNKLQYIKITPGEDAPATTLH
jgi:hypothetical protein